MLESKLSRNSENKAPPPLSPSPLLNVQNFQAPPFLATPPMYWFFRNPNPKNRIFRWTPIMLKLFILNHSLKFPRLNSQLTEKNIFPANPSKNWSPVNPSPFLKFWYEVQPPRKRTRGGVHYDSIFSNNNLLTSSKINLLNNVKLTCEFVDCKKECDCTEIQINYLSNII